VAFKAILGVDRLRLYDIDPSATRRCVKNLAGMGFEITACARLRTSSAMTFGSEAHLPRQTRLPSRRMETAVSFIETSRPIQSSMAVLLLQ
ncbi:MAG: hypothetical protein E5Y18_16450, partial [Mesorhizobium sp.]